MKTKSIKRLLRKVAKENDLRIDSITGERIVKMNCWSDEGAELIYKVYKNRKGMINEISYSFNWGGKNSSHDDLLVNIDVDNGKKFLKSVSRDFGGLISVNRKNIASYAVMVDMIAGVADGDESTMVSLHGGKHIAFA